MSFRRNKTKKQRETKTKIDCLIYELVIDELRTYELVIDELAIEELAIEEEASKQD